MNANWLQKYPKAAALLQGADDVLDYTPQSESGPEEPPGVMTVPASAGRVWCHAILQPLPAIAEVSLSPRLATIPVCTTAWPAPVCACGAWHLQWEGDRRR